MKREPIEQHVSPARVVHLTTVHHPFDPRIFYKQLGSLSEAGFDAHLVAPHGCSERTNGIQLHPLPQPSTRWHRCSLQRRAFQTARRLEADLYQIHDPELIPVGYFLKRQLGVPIVYDMHENYRTKGAVLGRTLRVLERWCFQWVDRVLLAEESYQSIVDGTPATHTYVANYFKPIKELKETGDDQAKFPTSLPTRLLYTGTISNSRGLRTMVELGSAIRERARPERLDLVGICRYSDQRAAVETRVVREGLDSVITRVGWDTYVPQTEMSSHYHRADVGLALFTPHPNAVESMPTKFYEYLHYGLPLICSDFPLWREFVEKHECGAVVSPGDVEAVLDVLDRWRCHPDDYRRCVRNARAAASEYRWEKMGDRLVRVYRDLLEAPRG